MRFNNIQVARIIAAGAVLLFHLAHYAEHRFQSPGLSRLIDGNWTCFPVPLFFAISGFVLTHAVRNARTGSFLFGRGLRLYPGFWLATILVSAVLAATGGLSFLTQMKWIGWTLRPGEFGSRLYVLGVEWSLVFEATLSVCLAGMGAWRSRWILPALTALWLIVLGIKIAVWPEHAMNTLPNWSTFFVSPFNVPFLLGVLTYYLRERGRPLRWVVLAGLAGFLAVVPALMGTLEELWCAYGFAAAVATWLAVQFRQLSSGNRFVRAGDLSYGLYLVHVPLIIGSMALLKRFGGLVGSELGVLIAGSSALIGGLLYGRLEFEIHRRLKRLRHGGIGLASALRAPAAIARACARRLRAIGSPPATPSGRSAESR